MFLAPWSRSHLKKTILGAGAGAASENIRSRSRVKITRLLSPEHMELQQTKACIKDQGSKNQYHIKRRYRKKSAPPPDGLVRTPLIPNR